MKLLNTALIRLTLVLLAGIFAGSFISLPLSWLLSLLAGLLIFFFLSFLRSHSLLLQDLLFGSSCLFLFFVLGLVLIQMQQPKNQRFHYSQQVLLKHPLLLVKIVEELKPGIYQDRYLAEVLKMNGAGTHGKLLLLLPHEEEILKAGAILAMTPELELIPKPLNPQQFNYRNFMANRGILFQATAKGAEYLVVETGKQDLQQKAQVYREDIIEKLRKEKFGKEELAVMQALLLGQRRDLSAETNEKFASAGVMHILAVSGLHVGIILLLLNGLLSGLDTLQWGRVIKILLLLLMLWSYALLAGLSPSVVRAVSMFSFVAVGLQLKRRTNVLNSLFLSLLLLLLLQPGWIWEVGFQLSYLAVFSIVIVQPLLYNLYVPKLRILRYFWSLLTVTLAAQVGVMPLSLYYFHQFPGLFFLSNLVILPFLGMLLGMGLLIIILSMLDLLPKLLSRVFDSLIQLLNDFVKWVAHQEDFLFQDIPFSLIHLIAIYALLLTLLPLLKGLTVKRIYLLLGAVICLQGAVIYEEIRNNDREFIVFHKNRHTVLGLKQKRQLMLQHNLKTSAREEGFVRNYNLIRGTSNRDSAALQNVFYWKNELLLLIDSSSTYRILGLQPERILLTGSPNINLERLLRDLKPREIIADGSNYRSYVNRWRETCRKRRIPFHYTGEKGFYILD